MKDSLHELWHLQDLYLSSKYYLEFTSPLPSKVKDLKVIFLSSLLDVSKTVMSHFVVSLR